MVHLAENMQCKPRFSLPRHYILQIEMSKFTAGNNNMVRKLPSGKFVKPNMKEGERKPRQNYNIWARFGFLCTM